MQTIVPLLLECWIECDPAQMTTGLPGSVMSSSSIDVMLAITEILKVIFKATQRNPTKNPNVFQQSGNCLKDAYFKDLNQHFMSFFPFMASHTPSIKGKRKLGKSSQQAVGEKTGTAVLALNLAICEIMLQFVGNSVASQKNYHTSVQKLEEFVIGSLELKAKGGAQQLQTEHVESLVMFAHQILLYHCSHVKQDSDVTRELLDAAYDLYQSSRIMSGTKRTLMMFFSNLVFPENPDVSQHKEVHGFIEKWLQGLPSLLVQLKDASPGMTELVLRVMKKAMVQHVLQPDDNCLAHLALFFSKDNGPFVNLNEAIQRSAVEMLFQLPSLDDRLLQIIVSCCHHGPVGVSVIQYILQVLHYRSPCYQGFVSHPAAFSLENIHECSFQCSHRDCSFCIMEEIIQPEQSGGQSSKTQEGDAVKLWQNHQMKLQAVCQCFRQCHQSDLLFQYMGLELETFLCGEIGFRNRTRSRQSEFTCQTAVKSCSIDAGLFATLHKGVFIE
ncbi:Testis-expressed sequence 10 protein [Desmophyllum pertusum]|uniref:Testis-expressed sequence 10 protein n=1 Tax=Desmophyllum pertusum TaxID=174260 RepID=A0A9W9YJW3_9CNID|nr:Testis-expressed sequence 10 protein [Desmophyllum pertusum]